MTDCFILYPDGTRIDISVHDVRDFYTFLTVLKRLGALPDEARWGEPGAWSMHVV